MARPKNFEPDDVVADAMQTFWTNGYANTSPADLAEATGVAKGSLYNTFGSKRELFDRSLELYDRAGAELTEEFLARPGTAKERIRAYLRLLVDTDTEGPVRRGCLAVNTAVELGGHDHGATTAVRRMQDRTIELLTNRIQQGQRDGDVDRDLNAKAEAQYLMTTIVGLRVMTKTFGARTLHRIIDTAVADL